MAERRASRGAGRSPLRLVSATEYQQLGRTVNGFDDATWGRARFEIVVTASLNKFGQNSALRAYLLATTDEVLVEASPTDRIWGIGLAPNDPAVADPARWRGENLLGFALMCARAKLAGEIW